MKKFVYTLVILLLTGCSFSNNSYKKIYKIGIDSFFYPNDFAPLNSNVYGFSQELLLEISKLENIVFEKISNNWDSLFDNLDEKKVDGVFSSKDEWNFNENKFNFSNVFLPIGAALVVNANSDIKSPKDLSKKIVAVSSNEMNIFAKQHLSNVIVKEYLSKKESLEELYVNYVDAVIMDIIPLTAFLNDVYYKKLKVIKILNKKGLKLITLNQQKELVDIFNRGLKKMKRKKIYQKLLKKWDLNIDLKLFD